LAPIAFGETVAEGKTMEKKQFIELMQRYVANIAIAGSTLRNQGAEQVVERAREFLSHLDLSILHDTTPDGYAKQLDRWTEMLKNALPRGAQNWGTARKAVNVFMVQAFLNKHLAQEYGLHRLGQVMETPLDSQATQRLRTLAGRSELPCWESIERLTPAVSQRYQAFASQLAIECDIPRACLDMMLWRAPD
jgi:hypothetical protein